MNGHEEEVLRAVPLRAPSRGLDERMEKLLTSERNRSPRLLRRAVPIWQTAAACAACAAWAFLAGTLVRGEGKASPANGEVRYVIQVEPKEFDVFDWTSYPKKNAPVSVLKAQLTGKEAGLKSNAANI